MILATPISDHAHPKSSCGLVVPCQNFEKIMIQFQESTQREKWNNQRTEGQKDEFKQYFNIPGIAKSPIITFVSNTKNFAIAIIFCVFFFSTANLDKLAKSVSVVFFYCFSRHM